MFFSSSSTILSGFYHILEDEEKNNTTIVALPNLVTQKHRRSYSNSWKAKVDLLFDVLAQESKPQEFESEETEKDDWIPDTLTFKDALRKDLPVANFYQWCYDYLNQQGTIITQNKYFIVTNLLLDDDIKADFQNLTINVNDRDKDIYHFESIMKFEIELQDASLTLPIIAAYGIS